MLGGEPFCHHLASNRSPRPNSGICCPICKPTSRGNSDAADPHEYCTRTHDSLKISNGKWCWNSRGIGGRTALDYLIKVRGLSFVEAVETLTGSFVPPPQKKPPPSKPAVPFCLPEVSRCAGAVTAYLQDWGIHPEIIGACLEAGIFYESRKYHNCVFVGRDTEGKARSAFLRGTKDGFKMDAAGSDKRHHFCLRAADTDCPRLAVAESPIDALSLATLTKLSGGAWQDNHHLSLGGTAPRALMQFLHDHPKVTQVSLCLDNDRAGIEGMERLTQAIRADPELSGRIALIHPNPPPKECGKDYNEFLLSQLAAVRAVRHHEAHRGEAR